MKITILDIHVDKYSNNWIELFNVKINGKERGLLDFCWNQQYIWVDILFVHFVIKRNVR